jgi:hypothetical protein
VKSVPLLMGLAMLPFVASDAEYTAGVAMPNAATASVLVVLKDQFPRSHIAALIRRTPGPNGQDIIAMRSTEASAELLAVALRVVRRAQARQGARAAKQTTIVIPIGLVSPRLSATGQSQMTDALTRLQRSIARAVPGVGQVRAIEIEVAP